MATERDQFVCVKEALRHQVSWAYHLVSLVDREANIFGINRFHFNCYAHS